MFLNTGFCQYSRGTYYFLPQIIQLTRITDHMTTLIDNIFISSMEHHLISGHDIIHDITDHLPNFIVLDKQSYTSNLHEIYQRNYTKLL